MSAGCNSAIAGAEMNAVNHAAVAAGALDSEVTAVDESGVSCPSRARP
jgi:hypothetical protein